MFSDFRCRECGKIDWGYIKRKIWPGFRKPVPLSEQLLPDEELEKLIVIDDDSGPEGQSIRNYQNYLNRKLQKQVIDDIDDDLAG